MSRKKRNKSIRVKLLKVFTIVAAIVFAANLYIYYNINRTIREIDSVYTSNIRLNQLSETLDNVQGMLYQYLNTKSTESLENYYMYEQDYRNMIATLNEDAVDNEIKLAEKSIYNMSESYLDKAEDTVEAKRGRNVAKYNSTYEEAEKLHEYLQTNIHSMNTVVFLQNSANYSVLRSSLNDVIMISILLLFAVIAIATVWIILMTRSITRPLVELADAANEIALGNMEVDFPIVETGDEITTVAKACNKMLDSIRDYIQETRKNYERESRLLENELVMKSDLKEAQLKYLQAQINPHFLFNSLNAGAQLAMMEGAEKACIFIQNMADFFRYNVRKIDTDTTIREELELVDHYIYILNVRFSGDIHYHKQIDDRLVSALMPSMILQPIIENAINHGIRGMEGGGRIEVQVYSEDGMVCIRVTDNGTGIDQETADKIMRGESAHSQENRDSAGIGMDNVINRLRRYYNKEHVIAIGPLKGGGTEVIIYIPKAEGGTPHDKDPNL